MKIGSPTAAAKRALARYVGNASWSRVVTYVLMIALCATLGHSLVPEMVHQALITAHDGDGLGTVYQIIAMSFGPGLGLTLAEMLARKSVAR